MTYEVLDRSYNKDEGELTQFLILEDGTPTLKRASPENVLLYDPEDKLPFDGGMYDFLNGQQALRLSDDPNVVVAPTENEYAYLLRVRDNTIETTPAQADRVLQGILDVVEGEGVDSLVDLYADIIAEQVRRPVINALVDTFDESDRINVVSNGWLIDDFYLVDWTASLYTKDDDPEEADYVRSGSSVRKDDSYEFLQLQMGRDARDPDQIEVTINGSAYRLTEREMLFLSKVKWMLARRYYHPDEPFWLNADQNANVDWKTGEPKSDDKDDEPNLDKFNL